MERNGDIFVQKETDNTHSVFVYTYRLEAHYISYIPITLARQSRLKEVK